MSLGINPGEFIQISVDANATTTESQVQCTFADQGGSIGKVSLFTTGVTLIEVTTGPTVLSCPCRVISNLSVYNADTVAHTYTLTYVDSNGAIYTSNASELIQPGWMLSYENGNGWYVTDQFGGTVPHSFGVQSPNTVWAGPASGGTPALPTFRSLVAADIPALPYVSSTTAQAIHTVLAGPSGGSAAAPTFRTLVASDVPALPYVTSIGLVAPSIFNVGGSPVTTSGNISLSLANQAPNQVWAGPTSGSAAAPAFRALVPLDYPVFIASGATHAQGAVPDPGATAGTTRFLREDATWAVPAGSGSGTVTSVALSAPAIFTVSGSPVTTSGTLGFSLNTQSANMVLAGPASGSAAAPTFRTLVGADIPPLVGITNGSNAAAGIVGEVIANTGSGVSLTSATWTTVCSIALTPGDWTIEGGVIVMASAAVLANILGAINTTNSAPAVGYYFQNQGTAINGFGGAVPSVRVNITTNTTYLLLAFASFATGTVSAGGQIFARRTR